MSEARAIAGACTCSGPSWHAPGVLSGCCVCRAPVAPALIVRERCCGETGLLSSCQAQSVVSVARLGDGFAVVVPGRLQSGTCIVRSG